MDGSVTDEQAHQWLQMIAEGNKLPDGTYSGCWISLHNDTPALGGADKAEIIGGGYVRFKMSFSQPSNRTIWSMQDAKFTGLVQNKLLYFGVWDAANLGMLRAYGELPKPTVVLNGKGFILPVGLIAISFG